MVNDVEMKFKMKRSSRRSPVKIEALDACTHLGIDAEDQAPHGEGCGDGELQHKDDPELAHDRVRREDDVHRAPKGGFRQLHQPNEVPPCFGQVEWGHGIEEIRDRRDHRAQPASRHGSSPFLLQKELVLSHVSTASLLTNKPVVDDANTVKHLYF